MNKQEEVWFCPDTNNLMIRVYSNAKFLRLYGWIKIGVI